jgi:hypothetical protein
LPQLLRRFYYYAAEPEMDSEFLGMSTGGRNKWKNSRGSYYPNKKPARTSAYRISCRVKYT